MDRRLGGVLLLLVAVVLVVVVPQALDPGESGSASRAPMPPPPAVGSCLRGPDNDVVPCEELHDSEVVAAWIAGDPARPRGSDVNPCWVAAYERLGDLAADTVLGWERYGTNIGVQLVRAPESERAGRLGWKACAVLPAVGGQYTGSVLGVGDDEPRSGAFANCVKSVPARVVYVLPDVNCLQPHGGELLGWVYGFEPNVVMSDDAAPFAPVPTDDEFRAKCADLAAQLMGVSDPTYAGALALSTLIESAPGTGTSSGAREVGGKILSELTYSGISTTAICMVRPADKRLLIDSVVGLGDREPPLQ